MTTVIQHFKFTVTEEIHYTTYTSPFVDAMQAFKVQWHSMLISSYCNFYEMKNNLLNKSFLWRLETFFLDLQFSWIQKVTAISVEQY